MNALLEWLYKIADTIFTPSIVPATFGGAVGGGYKAYHDKLAWRSAIFRIFWGIVFARMCSKWVTAHVGEDLQFIVFFVIGYGAIEIVDRILQVGSDTLNDIIDAKAKAFATKAKMKIEAAAAVASAGKTSAESTHATQNS